METFQQQQQQSPEPSQEIPDSQPFVNVEEICPETGVVRKLHFIKAEPISEEDEPQQQAPEPAQQTPDTQGLIKLEEYCPETGVVSKVFYIKPDSDLHPESLYRRMCERKRKQRLAEETSQQHSVEASEQQITPDLLKTESITEDELSMEYLPPPAPRKKKYKKRIITEEEKGLCEPTLPVVYQVTMLPYDPDEVEEDLTLSSYNTIKMITGLDPYLTDTYAGASVQVRQTATRSILRAVVYTVTQHCISEHFQKLCKGCTIRSPSQKNHDCLLWTQFFMNQQIRCILKGLNCAHIIHLTVCVGYALKVLEMKHNFIDYLLQLLTQLQNCDEPKQELEKMLKLSDKSLVKSVENYIRCYNPKKDFLFLKLDTSCVDPNIL